MSFGVFCLHIESLNIPIVDTLGQEIFHWWQDPKDFYLIQKPK